MIRSLLLIGCCLALLGTSCPSGSTLTCANDLDGSEFGFTMTVPSQFDCTGVFPNPFSLAQVRYLQSSTDIAISVQVNRASTEDDQASGDGITTEELADLATANGITFERQKVTIDALTGYVGGATMQSGNLLFITVIGSTDQDASMQTTLDAILETIQWVQPTEGA